VVISVFPRVQKTNRRVTIEMTGILNVQREERRERRETTQKKRVELQLARERGKTKGFSSERVSERERERETTLKGGDQVSE